MINIKKCPSCKQYTLKETCPACNTKTLVVLYKYKHVPDAPKNVK